MNIRLVELVVLELVLLIATAFLLEHSIAGALKGRKLALKSEFATGVGRLNLLSMVLMVFLIVFLNLHEAVARALRVEGASPATGDHVLATHGFGRIFFHWLVNLRDGHGTKEMTRS